jgi:hypothetical protein
LYGTAYVDPVNPTLEIVTRYDIEYLWDFGFIQVSTDGGAHWVSQSNEYTTSNHDPNALAAIVANLPGLTGNNPGYPAWTTMTFDLTAYASQTVLIGFRYMTDSATLGAGWWIQSADVGGTALTLAPARAPLPADFKVSIVRVYVDYGIIVKYIVNDMELNSASETGTKGANIISTINHTNYVILVVSPVSRKGFVDYAFHTRTPIAGDVNLDTYVDAVDFGILAVNYGKSIEQVSIDLAVDINNDGFINAVDFGILAVNYGKSL